MFVDWSFDGNLDDCGNLLKQRMCLGSMYTTKGWTLSYLFTAGKGFSMDLRKISMFMDFAIASLLILWALYFD